MDIQYLVQDYICFGCISHSWRNSPFPNRQSLEEALEVRQTLTDADADEEGTNKS